MAIIFFSHGTPDYPIVESFKNELEQMKSEVYLFEHDRQPNQDITNKVQKNIDRADIVTVLLTKQSEHSGYVQQEIGYAERARKPILPLVETGTDPNSLAMLTGRQYISFDPSDPYRSLSAMQTFIHNHEREGYHTEFCVTVHTRKARKLDLDWLSGLLARRHYTKFGMASRYIGEDTGID